MKRFLALLAVGAAVAATLAVPSGAVDTQGPACADIVGDTIGYLVLDPVTGEAVLEGDLMLASPSCAAVTYTLYIYASDGTNLLATQTVTGLSGAETIRFTQTFDAVGEHLNGLCLVATTSLGRHVADRAPDGEGCIPVAPDSSGGVGFQ